MSPFIETFSGTRFQPLNPVVQDIWIEDIAHALSNQCRFSGHTREFYSVAEHCVRCAELLEEWGEDESIQFWGLMHDASEAYLVDLATPLKQSAFGEAYRAAETPLMRAICYRFDMPPTEPERVRFADAVMLATEARDLMPNRPEHWKNLMAKPHDNRISAWPPKIAEFRFLEKFHSLEKRR
jgi:5'-deoxynucleotidase YfbR-like HD superfamily hydrolase